MVLGLGQMLYNETDSACQFLMTIRIRAYKTMLNRNGPKISIFMKQSAIQFVFLRFNHQHGRTETRPRFT
jgi:hypothetical protein